MEKFFKRHHKLKQFICDHRTSTDVGILTLWSGEKLVISQCDYCGLLIADGKRYRLVNEL